MEKYSIIKVTPGGWGFSPEKTTLHTELSLVTANKMFEEELKKIRPLIRLCIINSETEEVIREDVSPKTLETLKVELAALLKEYNTELSIELITADNELHGDLVLRTSIGTLIYGFDNTGREITPEDILNQ